MPGSPRGTANSCRCWRLQRNPLPAAEPRHLLGRLPAEACSRQPAAPGLRPARCARLVRPTVWSRDRPAGPPGRPPVAGAVPAAPRTAAGLPGQLQKIATVAWQTESHRPSHRRLEKAPAILAPPGPALSEGASRHRARQYPPRLNRLSPRHPAAAPGRSSTSRRTRLAAGCPRLWSALASGCRPRCCLNQVPSQAPCRHPRQPTRETARPKPRRAPGHPIAQQRASRCPVPGLPLWSSAPDPCDVPAAAPAKTRVPPRRCGRSRLCGSSMRSAAPSRHPRGACSSESGARAVRRGGI